MIQNALAVLFATTMLADPVWAQDCPASPDISTDMDGLIAEVQAADGSNAARAIANRMWTFWSKAPDAKAQTMLDAGMAKRSSYDLAGAVEEFDALVAYCPDYAEGYNQRAFANFIREEFDAALPDLDRAIALQPRHVAAIAGKGLTLIQMGRIREGQVAIRKALALNPWLSEKQYLLLAPETTDL